MILINDRLVSRVGKVFFLYFRLIVVTEHLIVLVHDIFDRGFFWKLSHPWQNFIHIDLRCQVYLDLSCCVRGKVSYQYYRKGRGYFMKNILSSLDPPGSVLSCPSTPISWSSNAWEGTPPPVNLCKSWNPHTVHLKSVFTSSYMWSPLKFQNFPGTPICLPRHISVVLFRRGRPCGSSQVGNSSRFLSLHNILSVFPLQTPFTTPLHISSFLSWGTYKHGSRGGKKEVDERKIFQDNLTTTSVSMRSSSYISYS